MYVKRVAAVALLILTALCRAAPASADDDHAPASGTSNDREYRFDTIPGFQVYQRGEEWAEHARWCSDNRPGYDEATDTYPSDGGRVRCVAPSD